MKEKKKYIPPTLDVHVVELEQGIAAGSVNNGNNININQEWNINEENSEFYWD